MGNKIKEEVSIGYFESRQVLINLNEQLDIEIKNLMIKQKMLKEILLHQDYLEFYKDGVEK